MPLFKKPKNPTDTSASSRSKVIENLGKLKDNLESKRRWSDTFIGNEKDQFEKSLALISGSRRTFDSMLPFRNSITESDFYTFVNSKIDEMGDYIKKIGPSTYPISDVYRLANELYDYIENVSKS